MIYANDNFGRWRSDFTSQIQHCLEAHSRGRPVVELLRPDPDDYFVLKPRHSGFYCTALDALLDDLGVQTVILTGFATNICVLFTANDAYLRDLHVVVPPIASRPIAALKTMLPSRKLRAFLRPRSPHRRT